MTFATKQDFDKALRSIKARGNNLVASVQTAIEYCRDQMEQHRNADPVKNLMDTLNSCRLDIRADVRAYLAHHLPVKITFSKSKGYTVKVVGNNVKEMSVPFDNWNRPKNDAKQKAMNADTLIKRFNEMPDSEQNKVLDAFKARFHLVEEPEQVAA